MVTLGAFSYVTVWLIALITAASLAAFQRPALAESWILEPYRVRNEGKYYTLITSGLIHADVGHLFFNMFTLYFFGTALENIYELGLNMSGIWVAALFFTGVVVSDLPTLYKHSDRRGYRTLGASGGVSSVVFASILLQPMEEICLYGILCFPGFIMGVAYLAYGYWQGKNRQTYINHDAHVAGALYGLVWQTVFTPGVWPGLINAVGGWFGQL